jgi:hypothetical protein
MSAEPITFTRTFRCPSCGAAEDFYFYTAANAHLVPFCDRCDDTLMALVDEPCLHCGGKGCDLCWGRGSSQEAYQ